MQDRDIHIREYLKVIVKRRQAAYTFFGVVLAISLESDITSVQDEALAATSSS